MASQVSNSQVHANLCPNSDATPETIRPLANFHPTIWGDYFLKYASESSEVDAITEEQYQKLKEEVKMILDATNSAAEPLRTLELIDTINRLGLSYHFEDKIGEILGYIKNVDVYSQSADLHTASLWFRLLRQEGYNISSDIFKKFTNKEGKFKDELTSDVQGMLSLYEASHLMVHGEPILEEALSFTTVHLQSSITEKSNLSTFLVAQVKHALKQPNWKGTPRVEAKHFISIYHEEPSHSEVLLNFAKLDFNIVQKLHRKELGELTRWWKELDLGSKLPYIFRDRLAESYFWIVGLYFEPKYALGRNILVKVFTILVIIDDAYDAYGKIEELIPFTNAVQSWNINCLDQLPKYMRDIYKLMLDIYDEIEELMKNEGRGSYRIQYAKNAMKEICRSYLQEAEWFNKDYIPTMEEHFKHSLVTGGQHFFAIHSFLEMGDIATEEAFEYTSTHPKIIRAGSLVTRLMGDIVSYKFEEERGHVASSVKCYVNQYGVSEEEAYIQLRRQVSEAWKDINEELIEPRAMPMRLLNSTINFARVVDVVYKDGDNYTHAGALMKNLIKSIFVDPVPM